MTHKHVSTKRYGCPSLILDTEIMISVPGEQVHFSCNAIWDTGASRSMITQRVAEALSLESLKMQPVTSIGAEEMRPVFSVSVGIAKDLKFVNIPVMGVTKLTEEHDALIGMDIISQLDFAITNFSGNTTHSIRFPSLHEIDYENSIPA